ncbi:hypothetical protein AHF37_12597 [Paragonimus kellicotti]|nr:hypothetical protein AHF37_12597 [Paragonimus kellicotti]
MPIFLVNGVTYQVRCTKLCNIVASYFDEDDTEVHSFLVVESRLMSRILRSLVSVTVHFKGPVNPSHTFSLVDVTGRSACEFDSKQNEAQLVYDAQWEEGTRRKGTIMLDQLDTELKNYKANSIKESIRRGSDDLGDLYLKMGQLNNARKCYTRSRDYCTSQQQEITMCLNVIKVSAYICSRNAFFGALVLLFQICTIIDLALSLEC